MNNTVKELSEAVRRYAAEQGEEFDLRKNADLVHFGMWLLRQNSGKPIVSGSLPLAELVAFAEFVQNDYYSGGIRNAQVIAEDWISRQ